MLVLSRKVGERIDVNGGVRNGGVTITVTGIDGNKVQLGFEAHRDVRINRRGVKKRTRQQRDNQGRTP